jgi:hypothetical protein
MILSDILASLSCSISPKTGGTICHETSYFVFKPAALLYLSVSGEFFTQPICFFLCAGKVFASEGISDK